MITLTKNGNAIVFTFSDNAHYLFDGTIEVPVNSLTLITDNSQMATFKKSASNDIFISATYAELGMSKSELESWFKENACGSTGGGGVTSGEVETMIETSLEDYYDIDEIDAALSAKANTATTYTKTEVDTALANKADTSAVTAVNSSLTAHTADTDIHVTSADKTAWNAKSDFSGSYNDLTDKPTIPTVPTSNTAFTNDAGYITSGEAATQIEAATSGKADKSEIPSLDGYATETWVEGKGYLTEHQSLVNYYTKSETSGATEISTALASKADTATTYTKTETDNAITAATSTKQDTLVSGTNIKTINGESVLGSGNIDIQGGGGGKAINAGRGISVTTGETADTVSFNLPISGLPKTTTAVTDNNLVFFGTGNTVAIESKTNQNLGSNILCGKNNVLSLAGNKCSLQYNTIFGQGNEIDNEAALNASSNNNFVFGSNNKAYGNNNKYNLLFGDNNQMTGKIHVTVFGTGNNPQNQYETIFGKYSVSHTGSTNADKSLFSVGNGTSSAATHNAFEIRQNGDIYITKDGQDVKLQDQLGGGGSSYTAGDGIDITNDVISVTGKVDTTAYTAYSAATDSRLAEDEEVTAAGLNALNDALGDKADTSAVTASIAAAVSGKQDTLIAGSGITISGNVISANGGGSITVDTALDSGSTNPVENRVIYDKFDEVEQVTAAALNTLNDRVDAIDITVDDALDATSENPVQNKVIYAVIGDIESLLSNI